MRRTRADVAVVIGVDTHKATYTASAVTRAGAELATLTVASDASGHRRLLAFARHASGPADAAVPRLWALEGAGSFGCGLTAFLLEQGEAVAEIDRPARPARRTGAKTDQLDATRAAREALARPPLAEPRCRGTREAVRVLRRTCTGAGRAKSRAICHLKALIVTAPRPLRDQLRDQLRGVRDDALLPKCARLRTTPQHSVEHRATVTALRLTARRALALEAEADDLESQLEPLVQGLAPHLLAEPGIGVLTAAELLVAWSHAGRVRSAAAFAQLAGVAPIPASSGQVTRHRLNRGGDRHVNCALHQIVRSRLGHHVETRAYAAKRTAEGKSPRDIKRCLKRFVARRVFRLLERPPTEGAPPP
ncbi:IS110 family transposase [Gemmatimonadetes bacterium T265]|nr:IS110 family transposase [Gemmatimonadetes bacterium T265]